VTDIKDHFTIFGQCIDVLNNKAEYLNFSDFQKFGRFRPSAPLTNKQTGDVIISLRNNL
jgi:hypothetical protein